MSPLMALNAITVGYPSRPMSLRVQRITVERGQAPLCPQMCPLLVSCWPAQSPRALLKISQ